MNGRNRFMLMARTNSLEFSTLRRATFSTLCLLCQITNDMRGFQLFIHASMCKDAECNLKLCRMLKAAVDHSYRCLSRFSCTICQKLVKLYCHHSKYCTDQLCNLPFCQDIKEQLNVRKLNER